MTRVRCVVRSCNNASYKKDSHCSFHDFPANKELSQKWLAEIMKYEEFCGWVPNVPPKITEHTKICSEHFEKTCFQEYRRKTRLIPTAVPTIFPAPVKSVHLNEILYSDDNSCNLEKERNESPEGTGNIPGSDHTYGKTVIQPSNGQQQKEIQPNQVLKPTVSEKDVDDDVIFLSASTRATTQTLSITPPVAPYDLTRRMMEEPKTTESFKRIIPKSDVTLPIPTSASNQRLVACDQTVIQPRIPQQQNEFQSNEALQLSSNVIDLNDDVIPSKRTKVDLLSVPSLRAPYDLTGRMIEEPQKTIPGDRFLFSNPTVTFPLPTSASIQGLLIYVPKPTPFAFPIPAQNSNCYQASTPVTSSVVESKTVTSSVVASNTVTENCDGQVQQQQISEEKIVASHPMTCKPKEKKELSKNEKDRRDKVYLNQVNMVRKLRRRVEQMEKTYAKLLNTVGYALYERSKKDVRVKRLFRSIEAILSGDENGEDHPGFLIDQILNFNAKTSSKVKYSQATLRSSIALNAKSPSTYDFIRNQGVIILPCRNTLAINTKKAAAKVDEDVVQETAELDDAFLSLQTMA